MSPGHVKPHGPLVAVPERSEPQHLHVERPGAELAVAPQTLGDGALAPVDGVREPAVGGELAGELLVGLDRPREPVDLGLEVSDPGDRPAGSRDPATSPASAACRPPLAARSSRIRRSSSISEWISGSRARAERWSFASVARDSSSRPAIRRNRAAVSSVRTFSGS